MTSNNSSLPKSNIIRTNNTESFSEAPKQVSWVPFVVIGVILSGIAAVAINFVSASSEFLIVGGVIGLILAIAILQKPELGTYLLIFSVFTNLSDLFTEKGLVSINKPLVGIVVLSILANLVLRTGKLSPLPKFTLTEFSLIAYCGVVIASFFVAVNPDRSMSFIVDLLKDIAILFSILITLNSREKWVAGANVLLLAIAFVSILGVLHTLTGSEQTFWGFAQQSAFGQTDGSGDLRFGGPIGESNIWGQVLVSIIPFAIYRFSKSKTFVGKFYYAAVSFLIFLCVLFTQSRGAFLALAVVLILTIIEMRIRGPVLLTLAVIGIAFLFLVPSKYTERIRTLDIFFQTKQDNSYLQDESIEGRREKMLTGLAMFTENPILGVGFANYTDNYWEYAGNLGLEASAKNLTSERSQREAHSLYIEIMAETGLLGILTFLSFFGLTMRGVYQARIRYRTKSSAPDKNWSAWITATGFSIITFLVAGFFLHGIGFRFIWVLAGLALSIVNISKNEATTKYLAYSK